MENPPPDPDEATLHEYIDAEIEVTGLTSPADEQALTAALEKLPGVRRIGLVHGRVEITYEPVRITQAELTAEIQRAGYAVAGLHAAATSPVADAFSPHGEETAAEETEGKE